MVDDLVDRFLRAAVFLDGHHEETAFVHLAMDLAHAGKLHLLAAKADEKRGADIRMRRIAPENALQVVEAGAGIGHAAAGAMGKGGNAVDMRIVIENAGMVDDVGGAADHRRRTVHRAADRDIIARAGGAVGAAIAHEGAGHDGGSGPPDVLRFHPPGPLGRARGDRQRGRLHGLRQEQLHDRNNGRGVWRMGPVYLNNPPNPRRPGCSGPPLLGHPETKREPP